MALCQRARLESAYWDVWHWRQRLKPGGGSTLKDSRAATVLGNVDLLFKYIDYQQDVIHRFLKIVASVGNGRKNTTDLYNILCEQAERYIYEAYDRNTLRRGQVANFGRTDYKEKRTIHERRR